MVMLAWRGQVLWLIASWGKQALPPTRKAKGGVERDYLH
jgi:hypothetical protein